MSWYPLIVSQYVRIGTSLYKPEHWALVVLKGNMNVVDIYQILGSPDDYRYEWSQHRKFTNSTQYAGGCRVGQIHSTQLDWVKAKLAEVPITLGDATVFNCQTWVIEALHLLKYANRAGVDITNTSNRAIRAELAMERERWETGGDTIESRLF